MPEWEFGSDEVNAHVGEFRTYLYDLTDEELAEFKEEMAEREARRIPIGFIKTKQRVRIGGRRAGTWPKVK